MVISCSSLSSLCILKLKSVEGGQDGRMWQEANLHPVFRSGEKGNLLQTKKTRDIEKYKKGETERYIESTEKMS